MRFCTLILFSVECCHSDNVFSVIGNVAMAASVLDVHAEICTLWFVIIIIIIIIIMNVI